MTAADSQDSTGANLRARQWLWLHQVPPVDGVGWVIDLTGATAGSRVLDIGSGNGAYLDRL